MLSLGWPNGCDDGLTAQTMSQDEHTPENPLPSYYGESASERRMAELHLVLWALLSQEATKVHQL